MLWNIPKAVGSRNDFTKPSILEGNTLHLQHSSRHSRGPACSLALYALWPCALCGTAHSVALRVLWHCTLRGPACSMALHTPWDYALYSTAHSMELCIMHLANTSVFRFIQSSQRVRELVSFGICTTEGTGTHE